MTKQQQVQNWFKYAQDDLETAETLLEHSARKEYNYRKCIHNCHQAIEKALKAMLIDQEQDIPKTHDLVALARQNTESLPEDYMELLKTINPLYLSTKYPDTEENSHHFTENGVKKILQQTKQIISWTRKNLNKH